jgi:sigma-B regulation protein RsbU (phosphoserine phosphatase)
MIWWLITLVSMATTAYCWRKILKLKEDLSRLYMIQATSSFNKNYNEFISEVTVLLQEKIDQVNIKNELATASALQETLLPKESHDYLGLSVSGRLMLASGCGGDWWYHSTIGDKVCFWIGDVTGHGVASALIASACRGIVGSFQHLQIDDPAEAMRLMNQILFPMTRGDLFVTAVCITIVPSTGETTIVNASHPSVVQLKKAQPSLVLNEPMNPPLGVQASQVYRAIKIQLDPKDTLFLMTDGLLEFPRATQPIWSLKRLLSFLDESANQQSDVTGIVGHVQERLNEYPSTKKDDDVTFLAIQRTKIAS